MKKIDTTKPGWNLPVPVRDKFAEWCQSMGTKAQNDCAGALVVWPLLPASVRETAKMVANGIIPYNDEYWQRFQQMAQKLEVCHSNRWHENPRPKQNP